MASAQNEMLSFISKFSQLTTIGCNSTLTFNSINGTIYASFTAELGSIPHGYPYQTSSYHQDSGRTTSQIRRRHRRRLARASTAANTSEVKDADEARKMNDSSGSDNDLSVEETVAAGNSEDANYDPSLSSSSSTENHTSTIEASSNTADTDVLLSYSSEVASNGEDYAVAHDPINSPQTTLADDKEKMKKIGDRPICEISRKEFYEYMNLSLGLNIQPS